ncbi:MAG: NUDIX domain-containing protein [Syntrophomonadaceae bacterium]|nr:NUDIX domain-containing protein [Syntrophomonadaceae bacterium]
MNEAKRIIFSVKALIFNGGKFLALHKKSNYRMPVFLWDLPGGTMEFGEAPQETIVREIVEETSLNVSNLILYDTWIHKKDEMTQLAGVIYLCQTGDTEVMLSNEHDRFIWLTLDAPDVNSVHPAFRTAIAKLRDERRKL